MFDQVYNLLQGHGYMAVVVVPGEELHQLVQSRLAGLRRLVEIALEPFRILPSPEPGPDPHHGGDEEDPAVPGRRGGSLVTDCQIVMNPGLQLGSVF